MNGQPKLTFGLACLLIVATASTASAMRSRVIVTLTSGTDAQAAADSAAAAGAVITHVFHQGYSGLLPGKLITLLRSQSDVTGVERDRRVRAAQAMCTVQSATPSWGLDRISERASVLDGEYQYETTASNVNVYVLDTGIDTQNSDFGARATWGVDEIDGSQQDCHGHGTAVAGTIGGTSFGVAKQASLIAVRVLNCHGVGFDSDVVAGLEWAVDHHVANPKPAVAVLALSGKLSNAVNAAASAATAAGLVTVVAAGNNHGDACSYSPASAANVMSVAASDIQDHVASFSNGGTCVSLFAPGVAIRSDWPGGSSRNVSGTSMSAAFVAGVAALTAGEHPSWTPSQVRDYTLLAATAGVVSGPSNAPPSPNLLVYRACDI